MYVNSQSHSSFRKLNQATVCWIRIISGKSYQAHEHFDHTHPLERNCGRILFIKQFHFSNQIYTYNSSDLSLTKNFQRCLLLNYYFTPTAKSYASALKLSITETNTSSLYMHCSALETFYLLFPLSPMTIPSTLVPHQKSGASSVQHFCSSLLPPPKKIDHIHLLLVFTLQVSNCSQCLMTTGIIDRIQLALHKPFQGHCQHNS